MPRHKEYEVELDHRRAFVRRRSGLAEDIADVVWSSIRVLQTAKRVNFEGEAPSIKVKTRFRAIPLDGLCRVASPLASSILPSSMEAVSRSPSVN
jgi:hypothetical protein